jgi:two-component system, NarL family, nitrate/nitrite response regulator NarL
MTPRPRILIADFVPTRVGVKLVLEPEVEVCAEASTAEEAIAAAWEQQPDLCLIRLELPGDGLAAVRGIRRVARRAAVVVLSDGKESGDLVSAVRAGALGYAPAPVTPGILRAIVRAVLANEAAVPRSMVRELMIELRGGGDADNELSARELEVLGLLRRGHSTAVIAKQLQIAPVTVRRHISEVVRKVGVDNRSELTEVAGA